MHDCSVPTELPWGFFNSQVRPRQIIVCWDSLSVWNIYSWFHLYGYCLLHIPTPFFFSTSFLPVFRFFHFLPARGPSLENVTAAIFSYAVSHLHEGTGKLRKTCADTVGHLTEAVPESTTSEKMTSRSAFRYADRGLAATHLSTDRAPSFTWVTAYFLPLEIISL